MSNPTLAQRGMPKDARVRFDNFPGQIPPRTLKEFVSLAAFQTRNVLKLIAVTVAPERFGLIPVTLLPPVSDGELPTFDGNGTTEAVYGHSLVSFMDSSDYTFLHTLADNYPELEPRRFDAHVYRRRNREGKPYEWNESLWCSVGGLRRAHRLLLQQQHKTPGMAE